MKMSTETEMISLIKNIAFKEENSRLTVKRFLNELENAELIMWVRQQGFGEPNYIYILILKKGT